MFRKNFYGDAKKFVTNVCALAEELSSQIDCAVITRTRQWSDIQMVIQEYRPMETTNATTRPPFELEFRSIQSCFMDQSSCWIGDAIFSIRLLIDKLRVHECV